VKLRDLDARFVRVRREQVDPTAWIDGMLSPSGVREYLDRVDLAQAQGLWFDCPCQKCQASEYGGSVLVGFEGRGAPDDSLSQSSEGGPSRWKVEAGSGLDDLQLSPSIQLNGACNWHGFVGWNGVPAGEAA
jgi:hypothetical protein